jgi:hypothetical protein
MADTFRETRVTVAGTEHVIRTELGGKVRTVRQLESTHTKAVKAALIDARRANLPALMAAAKAAEAEAKNGNRLAREAATLARRRVRTATRGSLPV